MATLRAGIDGFSAVLFRVVGYVTRLAPIGALGAMAFTIGSQGIGALAQLAMLMLCFYATCVLFVFGVLGPFLPIDVWVPAAKAADAGGFVVDLAPRREFFIAK